MSGVPTIEALQRNGVIDLGLFENCINLMSEISLLNSVDLTPGDIVQVDAKSCMENFQAGYGTAFGGDRYNISVHLVCHLPENTPALFGLIPFTSMSHSIG